MGSRTTTIARPALTRHTHARTPQVYALYKAFKTTALITNWMIAKNQLKVAENALKAAMHQCASHARALHSGQMVISEANALVLCNNSAIRVLATRQVLLICLLPQVLLTHNSLATRHTDKQP